MKESLEINGTKLVSIKQAATLVHYSRDYVARLAREEKIVASQVGRQWYVDVDSLRAFAAHSSLYDEVRKRELSATRKRELTAVEQLHSLRVATSTQVQAINTHALGVATGTLILGLFVGVWTYTFAFPMMSTTKQMPQIADVSRLTLEQDLEQSFAFLDEPEVFPQVNDERASLLFTTVLEQPVFVPESTVTKLSAEAVGILVFPSREGNEPATVQTIAGGFSDPVEVTFADDGRTGSIVVEGDLEGEVYPFVVMPIGSE